MRLAAVFAATTVVAFCAITALLFYLHSDPSTAALDSDIAEVRSQITAAETEAAKYEGGLVRAMIVLRLEVLRTTESMLQQKKTSFLRKIDLRYAVQSAHVTASREQLNEIGTDIAEAKTKLDADEREARKYAGGLVQGLALATVATQRLTLAQLHLSYLGAKYGFIVPQVQPLSADKEKAEPPGTPVQDRQAFE